MADHDTGRDDEPEPPGGSGTVGEPGRLQEQAGSLARDAEQDPELGRDHEGGRGAHDELEDA